MALVHNLISIKVCQHCSSKLPLIIILQSQSMNFSIYNINALDRTLRIGTGLLLIALASTDIIGAWGYIGLLPLLTGVIGVCPGYGVFGFSTCSRKR